MEEGVMTHRSRSETEKRKDAASNSHSGPPDAIGGREFGQVIEPMQAQMASENEGLAESPQPAPPRKSGGGNKPKAA
jgi:hypothetical protein